MHAERLPKRPLFCALPRTRWHPKTKAQGQLREATEIQNLQIGEGDVCRGLVIPVYMVLPRLFSCPTMVTPRFRVEFELNVIVCFAEAEGYTATQNFQILLV
ncbi:unnamed protein product [Ectocarpus sp. 13 AM-2016]